MNTDKEGKELQEGDWVKCVVQRDDGLPIGTVLQINKFTEYNYFKDCAISADRLHHTFDFVKVERHPHADVIIAAASDMDVNVKGFEGEDVFKCCSFYESANYFIVDYTLEKANETPEQKEFRETREALAEQLLEARQELFEAKELVNVLEGELVGVLEDSLWKF